MLLMLACCSGCGGGEVDSRPPAGSLLLARISQAVVAPEAPRFLEASPSALLLRRARLAEALSQRHGPSTSSAMLDWSRALLRRLDPVWGGLLAWMPDRLAEVPAATTLLDQALALDVFAGAWALSREAQFRRAFERVDEYIQDQLRRRSAPDDRSAAAALGYRALRESRPEQLPARFSVADYWQLRSEHDRRQLGVPALSGPATAADLATLALSYLRAARAFDSDNYRAEAVLIAGALASAAPLPLCEGGAAVLWLWHQLARSGAGAQRWQDAQQAALDAVDPGHEGPVSCGTAIATARANALLAVRAHGQQRPSAHLLAAAIRSLPPAPETAETLAVLAHALATLESQAPKQATGAS